MLVAGYDVFGNVGHQFNSRLYLDFLRREGESNFLMLLPMDQRKPTRDFWYRGTSDEVKNYVYGHKVHVAVESDIDYRTDNPQRELLGLLKDHVAPALNQRFALSGLRDEPLRAGIASLGDLSGANLQWLPETVFLRVYDAEPGSQYFTLLRNVGHTNVSNMFKEQKALVPAEDTLTVVPGFIGAYPNAFYRAGKSELAELRTAIRRLSSEQDYRSLADRYATRRSDTAFWAESDQAIDAYAEWAPDEAGLFDYNRLENR